MELLVAPYQPDSKYFLRRLALEKRCFVPAF